MSDLAIRVESLGKQYVIGHQKSGDLRESFSRKVKSIFSPHKVEEEEFWALRDVSFEVRKGEAVGIIGRNGAGKSTLLKLLSRITEPTTGRFELNGRVSSLLEVGTGFHPELTGRENIFLNGTVLGMRRGEIKSRFDEIVAFSGVEKFIDTPVKHYSSGMKVRLAFSVAAHLEPEILIIDEVLAVGDAEFQRKCLGKMDEVSKNKGRTVLFVSHNMGAVSGLCKYGILLDEGRVSMDSDMSSVVDQYLRRNGVSTTQGYSRRNAKGDQEVIVSDIKFFDDKGVELEDIMTGQKVIIEISYTSAMAELKDVTFGLSISNSQNQFLTVLNNGMASAYFDKLPGKGKVFCVIPKLPLMHGLHTMGINLFVDGRQQDMVDSFKSFYVENSDYYGSGFSNASNRQGVYIEQEWRV